MFILSNLLVTIARILEIIASIIPVIYWLIVIRALLSWVSPDPYNPLVQFLYRVTEPILAPFRSLIPSYRIGLDLSPIFAILSLFILQAIIMNFFVRTLIQLAQRMA